MICGLDFKNIVIILIFAMFIYLFIMRNRSTGGVFPSKGEIKTSVICNNPCTSITVQNSEGKYQTYKYEKVAHLGRGSFGSTDKYKLYDPPTSDVMPQFLAIKTIYDKSKTRRLKEYNKEINVVREINNHQIYNDDYGRYIMFCAEIPGDISNEYQLAMEIMSTDLYHYMKENGSVTYWDIKIMIEQLAKGLEVLWEKNMFYADVKFGNTGIVDRDFRRKGIKPHIKLIDLGSVYLYPKRIDDLERSTMTYISPNLYNLPEEVKNVKQASVVALIDLVGFFALEFIDSRLLKRTFYWGNVTSTGWFGKDYIDSEKLRRSKDYIIKLFKSSSEEKNFTEQIKGMDNRFIEQSIENQLFLGFTKRCLDKKEETSFYDFANVQDYLQNNLDIKLNRGKEKYITNRNRDIYSRRILGISGEDAPRWGTGRR